MATTSPPYTTAPATRRGLLARFSLRSSHGALPGFGLSMGITMLFLSLIVIVPLSTVILKSAQVGWSGFFAIVASPRALASYRLTFGASFVAATFNLVAGTVVAWVLVRYRFPGRDLVDGMLDLPFAIPTAVSGIALTALYSEKGFLGRFFHAAGIDVAFTRLGVTLALVFVTLPFVIRTVQPVLEDLEPETEEQAAILGASRLTIIRRIILPQLVPAGLTGFALAFARAIGEYGSVVFISGNMPGKTEIAPLLIMAKLEQFDYAGATSIALVMLVVSFAMLLIVNRLQAWSRKRTGLRA